MQGALLAGLAVAGMLLWARFYPPLALLLGSIVGGCVYLLLAPSERTGRTGEAQRAKHETPHLGGDMSSPGALLGVRSYGAAVVSRLREHASAVRFQEQAQGESEAEASAEIEEIAGLTARIFANFEQDPGDLNLPVARTFLAQTLPRAERLVAAYAKLSESCQAVGEGCAETQALEDARQALPVIRQGFAEVLRRCQENDLRQLDLDTHVLTRLLAAKFPELKHHAPEEDGESGETGDKNTGDGGSDGGAPPTYQ